MADEDTNTEVENTSPEDFTKYEAGRRAEIEGKEPPDTGDPPEKPAEKAEPGEEKTSDDAGQPERLAGEQEPQAKAEQEEETQKPKRKGGWQRKIESLERQNEQLAADLEASRQAKPAGEPKPKPEAKAPERPKRPRADNFDTDEALEAAEKEFEAAEDKYIEDLAAAKTKSLIAAARAEDAAKDTETIIYESHEGRVAEFKKDHADYDEVVAGASDEMIPGPLLGALLESELSPALAYHYAKNPDELEKLVGLPQSTALRHLGRLEATLLPESKGQTQGYTPPPTPIKKVEGGSTPSSLDGKVDFAEYDNRRRAGEQPSLS